ncbi:hypothetical protein AAG906_008413 [Vitis piasezkii]|uniref:Autophagy-related protein 27 n=2 Tax=Vitis vinifera TaxID=29760 RepID=D7T4J0_VITVI|eukprot:XP_002273745.2 PREDICTED: uncharacterized protein LOC100255420 [Vitis vinifera]
MRIGGDLPRWVLILTILHRVSLFSASDVCRLSVLDRYNLYTFSLASPTSKFPHGVLSEDGFYKVAVNETVLWFQLCDGMIFNHDPPTCADCWDCGGPSRCGMDCSALVANNVKGYHVCTTIGRASSVDINLIDKNIPKKGVTVKMSSNGPDVNCSLSVSVICESNGVQGPYSLEQSGTCDYATEMRHPSGCAEIVSVHGRGLGWFSTFLIILFCFLGVYLLVGTVYRFFFLGVRGVDIIPNLGFWTSLPQRTQSSCASLVRKFRGPSQGHRDSYSAVNF